jgi:hypothetical protein
MKKNNSSQRKTSATAAGTLGGMWDIGVSSREAIRNAALTGSLQSQLHRINQSVAVTGRTDDNYICFVCALTDLDTALFESMLQST